MAIENVRTQRFKKYHGRIGSLLITEDLSSKLLAFVRVQITDKKILMEGNSHVLLLQCLRNWDMARVYSGYTAENSI